MLGPGLAPVARRPAERDVPQAQHVGVVVAHHGQGPASRGRRRSPPGCRAPWPPGRRPAPGVRPRCQPALCHQLLQLVRAAVDVADDDGPLHPKLSSVSDPGAGPAGRRRACRMPAGGRRLPAMPRIDAHQHFWRYSPQTHGWIEDHMAVLKRDFLPPDLEPLLRSKGYDGCVAVQAQQTVDETTWLLDLADQFPFIRGVVGWVDLRAARRRRGAGRAGRPQEAQGHPPHRAGRARRPLHAGGGVPAGHRRAGAPTA